MSLLLLAACSPAPEPTEMEPLRLLTRASLDLRGVRPSESEVRLVAAAPDAVEELVDGFVDDARFPERLVSLYHEIYLTETEKTDLRPNNIPFEDPRAFYWEVGQEPLRIVAQVAAEDLPYTEILTGDWTMANENMASLFPLEWEEGATGWHKTRYTDGRPAAGVMATNGLWWRYTTTEANANRRRANALTRILVCEDFLDRPIAFDPGINILDEAAVADALSSNPGCVNCHVGLDPVASNLFGFYWTNFTSPTEGTEYHAGKEQTWRELTGVAPGWYGTPTSGLAGLGHAIADDERFLTCAVRQAFERMVRRDATIDDEDDLTALREIFLDEGLRLKPLYRAIADLPIYRAGDVDSDRGVPVKMMSPDILADAVEALTGYRWTNGGLDVLTTDNRGLRSLAGGVEGVLIKQPAMSPGSTVLLVQEALAYQAAAYAVEAEAAMEPDERRLFQEIDFTETADAAPDAIATQLQALHLRVLTREVAIDGPEVAAGVELWSALHTLEGDVRIAWQGVLAALLRDPDFLLY